MGQTNITVSDKDRKFREFALRGNMWNVIFYVCTPLALYQSLNHFFKILDAIMAVHISAESVSAVAYLSQINLMLSAIGGGLAIGSGLKISEAYGAGDYGLVKARVSSLFAFCGGLGFGILVLIAPFTTKFLELVNTPQQLIAIGSTYFVIELIAMVISFFNNVYIAIERARGNSKRILYLNIFVILVKLTLTACFVYVLKSDITMIAVATVLSNLVIAIAAIINMRQSDNAFGFSLKSVTLKSNVIAPMLELSFPVMIERIAFAFGKVIINLMSAMYRVITVGALGISNNIAGLTTVPQNGFQEGVATIISQNLGANKIKRALDAFKKVLIINIILGIIGMFLTILFLDYISMTFASSNQEFARLIAKIYSYEVFAVIALGIYEAVMGLLYGFGYTELTLLVNFSRIFAFRIPILWALQSFTRLGSESVGIVMMLSNILAGAFAAIIAVIVVRRVCKENRIKFLKD